MEDCIFCKIIKRQLPASIVFENDVVIAFMDIQPVNPGHVLVVPKVHHELITELDQNLTGELFRIGTQINAAIRKSGVKCEGVNYFLADGEAAGQEIFHVHLHVFPRYLGDGFGLRHSEEYYRLPQRETLDETAKSICENL